MARLRILTLAVVAVLPAPAALAHPHEWIDAAFEVLFDKAGDIAAIRHHWRFDEGFTAFALQGLDTNGDGQYSAEELKPLAQENVEAVKDYDYFTFVTAKRASGDVAATFGAPTDYHLDLDGGQLTLHYTLPLAQPMRADETVLVQVYDPEYFIDFTLPSKAAARSVGAPADCRLAVYPAAGPDPAAAAQLATVGADQRALPDAMQDLTGGIDNSAEVTCGGPAPAAGEAVARDSGAGVAAARSAKDAVGMMAGGSATPGNLSAIASAAPGAPDITVLHGSSETPPKRTGALRARLAAWQGEFSRKIADSMKAMKTDGSAGWWLAGMSFLYGIAHAAGPGHGKVVISSYLLANEAKLRKGVALSFLSALLQAVVAVAIVGVMAIALGLTSRAMTRLATGLETASFALVALLGLYLLARKVPRLRAALTTRRPGQSRAAAHEHDHGHKHSHGHGSTHGPDCGCGHSHSPDPVATRPGVAGAAAAVLSVGVRPCSGALIVLVFALAQGVFWAGVASTFAMALGTALTVAALACLAVGAKGIAARLASGDGRRSAQIMLSLEVAAAAAVALVGAALFVGSLGNGGFLTG